MHRLLLLALALLAARPALSAPPSCDNPQDAARSLLDWLQPDQYAPKAAATCLGLPPERAAEGPRLAVRLKEVLDAKGLYVPVTGMSLDSDYVNADGLHRAEPLPGFPLLALVKRDGRWVFSRDIVGATDQLYEETFSGLSGQIQHRIPASWPKSALGLDTWKWAYGLVLLTVSLVFGLLAQLLLTDQVVRLARRAHIRLDPATLKGTRWPLTAFLVGSIFVWGLPEARLGVQSARLALFVSKSVASLAAVLILARVVDLGADYFGKKARATDSKMDDQVIPLVQRAAKVGIWVLGIVFVVQNMGVDVGSLLAGLGIGGLAFALAAKDTVENLFGSLTIFTDRPFQIGDWVVIGGDIEGVVEEVGFRSTRIRTFHNSLVSVPNGKVAKSPIDNMGKRRYRRVKATIGLTYDTTPDRLDAYVAGVRDHLEVNPAVWKGTCEVHFANFGASSLDVMLYFFLDVPDWTAELRERAAIYTHLLRLAEQVGVSYAFPSTSLYLEQVPPELRRMQDPVAVA